MNATLMTAEQEWRSGGDPSQIQARMDHNLTTLGRQFARLKSEQRLPLCSLAIEARQGRVVDPAVTAAMADLLKKRAKPAIGLKPEEVATADAKLLAEFQTATQDKPDFDVASAVFEAAVDAQVPDARAILSLEGLLRARRPTPGWVEILTLHRLAERALAIIQGKRPEESWKPETVRKLLGVVKAGEQAHAHADSPIWARPWLDAAALARHLGEVAFHAAGYVPLSQAEGHLERAAGLYGAVLAAQEHFENAVRLRDEAMELLPDYLPYLEHDPDLFESWSDALHAAAVLDAALETGPADVRTAASGQPMGQPPGIDALRAAIESIDRLCSLLRAPLNLLRSPFQDHVVDTLMARAKEARADASVWRAITALLDIPLATAEQRVALWNAAQELAKRLDQSTPSSVPVPSVGDESGTADPAIVLARGLTRRAAEALGLLKLAGLDIHKTHGFEDAILKIAKGSSDDGPLVVPENEVNWPRFVALLHQTWTKLSVSTGGFSCPRSRVAPDRSDTS